MKKFLLISLLVSLVFSACKKDKEEPQEPQAMFTIKTGSVSQVSNIEAMITGEIQSISNTEITAYGHVWSTNENPTVDLDTKTNLGSTSVDTSFTSHMEGLAKGTPYYARAYATNSEGTKYGEEASFITTDEFFKFVVDEDYFSPQQRGWVMIYSPEGDLLDYKELINNSEVEFDWPEGADSDRFILSFLNYTMTIYKSYVTSAYANIVPGTWHLKTEQDEYLEIIGMNSINLNGYNLNQHVMVEVKNKYSYGNIQGDNVSINQHFNPDEIWIWFMDTGEAPQYKYFGEVSIGESFNIPYGEFDEMIDYVDVTFSNNNSDYVYVESEDDPNTSIWEYYMVYFNSENGLSSVKTYYPGSTFNGYFTLLKGSNSNSIEYGSRIRGEVLSELISIPVDINIQNYSINNFNSSITGSCDLAYHTWNYYETTNTDANRYNYIIYGSVEDVEVHKGLELPADIYSLDPELLDLDNLIYSNTIFYEYDNYIDYNDFIDSKAQGETMYDVVNDYQRKIYYAPGKSLPVKDVFEEVQELKQELLGNVR